MSASPGRSSAVGRVARRVLQRLGWALAIVWLVTTASFFIARVLPGDPARMLLGPQARPADVAAARRIYGLDAPLTVQYVRFASRLVHWHGASVREEDHRSCGAMLGGLHTDLGFSYRYRQPVAKLIAKKAPRTIELGLAALALQALLGLGAGLFAASRRGSVWDRLAVGTTLLGVCAPIFVLGLALQHVLAHRLGWLPYDGYGATPSEQLRSLALPALTMGIYGAALYARLTRDEMTRALARDHVRLARAKGASRWRAVIVHGLRTAMLPIATLLVLDLGALVGGAVVTEKLFRWPGLGAMAVDAMQHRDGPVIVGTVIVSAAAIVAASVVLDLVALWLDPRERRPAS